MSTTSQPIPAPYRFLVDDAAMFPPGNAPLETAVALHREHQDAAYADLVGGFVISDVRLPDLLEVLRAEPGEPLPVNVVVTGGAGGLEPAVRWAGGSEELELRAVEVALRDEQDLPGNARRVVAAVDQLLAAGHLTDDDAVHVEPPPLLGREPTTPWLTALDEVAALELRLKFRTGGIEPEAFPTSADLAACIDAALDRELPFKCTAGLHHAVRHRDEETGFEHHGFLNVLLATRATLDGDTRAEVADLLDEHDPAALTGRIAEVGSDVLAGTRRWFTSFGSCSVLEPLEDLIELDQLPDLPLEPA